jgi:hypothetical protein
LIWPTAIKRLLYVLSRRLRYRLFPAF